jgi:hypothetical protein
MPLTLMVGINGCGKDTITKELLARHPETAIISGAQILMKNLGIDVGIEATFPPQTNRGMYRALEQTPVQVKAAMRDTVFKDTLLQFKEEERPGILLSQLVVIKPPEVADERATFSVEGTEWYPDVFDRFVHVHAPVDQIWDRREQDLRAGARDRGRIALRDLEVHDEMYHVAWSNLVDLIGDPTRMLEVENSNGQLAQSIERIDEFIYS